MFSKVISTACFIFAAFAMVPAVQAQERLELPEGEAWVHSHSGISVPPQLAGLDRSYATAFSRDELNTGLSFDGEGEFLSVYVYRRTNGGVPVWFEQARLGLMSRDVYDGVRSVGTVYSFALPGREEATALKVVFASPEGADYKSTGLAMFALGEWYVKLRATSKKLDVDGLEAWMTQAVGELGLPQELDAGRRVRPVTECAKPLAFPKAAKDAPKDGAAALLGGIMGMIASEKRTEASSSATTVSSVDWCRDVSLGNNQAVYRPNASTERYLIALGDSGIGVGVGTDDAAELLSGPNKNAKPRYTTTMYMDDKNVSFVAQDRLPSPKRVVELINGDRKTITVPTWGEDQTVEVNSESM